MSSENRMAFLAEVRVGLIAITRQGRAPLAVPIWYDYQPGGDVVVMMEIGSLKERLLREAGRFSLCVQQGEMPYKYVTAEGPVVAFEEEPSFERKVAIAARYLPREQAERFVSGIPADSQVIVRMRPEKWLSTDYTGVELG
ncbi:pyridoxamine 5'-phosphate oxidase family protein [Amycolatopsis aidingensis]|uniref:pyridoxamine 5'-phosphate oxidase n=1 Tax=Amycolatopsis aidingensis TaxID=2842453 RepID=UPI001E4DB155|nr:pyridoxamine 5'-phosphate oxidase [Amycolatopsis aidingensis]